MKITLADGSIKYVAQSDLMTFENLVDLIIETLWCSIIWRQDADDVNEYEPVPHPTFIKHMKPMIDENHANAMVELLARAMEHPEDGRSDYEDKEIREILPELFEAGRVFLANKSF